MATFKHIQWNGSNLEEVKQFLNNYDVVRHPKYEDLLIVFMGLSESLTVDKGDILAFDKDGYLTVLQNENNEQNSESEDEYKELKETARFFGLSDEDVNRMTGQLEHFVSSLQKATSEKSKSPFERMKDKAQQHSKNASDKVKQHTSDFVEKSKNHAKDAYFKSSRTMEEIKRKYQETAQKEVDMFNELREQEGYSGLTDNELRRIVKSRVFFDHQ